MCKPWIRQEGETAKAYAAFCVFMELGEARTYADAWRAYGVQYGCNKGAGSSIPPYFRRWYTNNNWLARALAYDDHMDEIRRDAAAKVVRKAQTKLSEAAVALIESAITAATTGEVHGAQGKLMMDLLDRAGFAIMKDLNVNVSGELKTESLTDIVRNIEAKTTAELARAYFDATGQPGEDE